MSGNTHPESTAKVEEIALRIAMEMFGEDWPNAVGKLEEMLRPYIPSQSPIEIGRLYCDLQSAISHLLGLIEAKGLEGWQIGYAKQVVKNVETQYFGYPVATVSGNGPEPRLTECYKCHTPMWEGGIHVIGAVATCPDMKFSAHPTPKVEEK